MGFRQDIDHGKAYDWGKVSQDYTKYRDIYPAEFFERILAEGLCVKGQTVLDLGTGTGVLPRNMYRYGARFTGTDISENQIAEARRLTEALGMDIAYIAAPAEALDFPAGSFDVVTACMCFFYFDRDVVLPKLHKLLKDGGRFCILYMSWMPDANGITNKGEELVLKYNPQWTGAGMKRFSPDAPDWSRELFDMVSGVAYDIDIPFTRESWHGRMRACRGIGASSLPLEAIAAFEKEHLDFLGTVDDSFIIPHYVTMQHFRKRTV